MYSNYTNPVNDFYFRNAQPQWQQMSLPFPPQQPQINCRFVTSIDEAKAALIDPVSTNLYLDSSTGKIYLKKLGNNGQSEFLAYSIEEVKPSVPSDPMTEINTRLMNIEKVLGGMKNDKSVSDAKQSEPVSQSAAAEQNEPNGSAEPAGFSENARNDFWKKRK